MQHPAVTITNHSLWRDTTGNPIDCHEGGIIRIGEMFYWYGRRYRGNVDGVFGPGGLAFKLGIVCYSSRDMVNWTDEGLSLDYPADGWITTGTWHRPRVIFNSATGKYVLWFFCLGETDGKWWAHDRVAVADTPTGPFELAGEPVISGVEGVSGDHALFTDGDGQGYLAKGDWSRNGWVLKLTDDFQSSTGAPTLAFARDAERGRQYEGVCLARYKGKCIYAGSGVVGIGPSETSYAIVDEPMGQYRFKGAMSEQKTWQSQISSFFYLAESDCLMALCDQWLVGADGQRVAAEFSCQLWLPISFDPATETAAMRYVTQWNPWTWR